MAFALEIIRPSDFIRLDADKRPSVQAGLDSLRRIARACIERKINRIIVDSREVERPLSVHELYIVARSLADVGFPREVWIAILPRQGYFDRAEFFALCAENRGWTVQPFRSFEDAIRWISDVEVDPPLNGAAPNGVRETPANNRIAG